MCTLIYGLAWQQREVDFVAVDSRYIGTTVNQGTATLYGYASGDGIGRFSEPGRNLRVSLAWQF